MQRHDIINSLIRKYNYRSYLEIGTQFGKCYDQIVCAHKECVDPDKQYPALTWNMTSDEFFDRNSNTFDFIFVDGLHVEHQVTRDVRNSLDILNHGGTIMCHDCLPESVAALETHNNGTCYASIVQLRCSRDDLRIATVDTDCGCSIIRRGSSKRYDKVHEDRAKTFKYWLENKKEIMNIISVNQFNQLI